MLFMAICRIARQLGDIGWSDTKSPKAIRSMNPFAYIHKPAVLILDFYETSGFRAGRSVEHDIHKHGLIVPRVLFGCGCAWTIGKMLRLRCRHDPFGSFVRIARESSEASHNRLQGSNPMAVTSCGLSTTRSWEMLRPDRIESKL